MNPNYDPNTLDCDQKRAKKRKKICILSIVFVALLLAVGLGIGLWRVSIHEVLYEDFLKLVIHFEKNFKRSYHIGHISEGI